MLYRKDNFLVYQFNDEKVYVEAWGTNGVRVRITKKENLRGERLSALIPSKPIEPEITIMDEKRDAKLVNGKITAEFKHNVLHFFNDKGEELLKEFWQGASGGRSVPHNSIWFQSRTWRVQAGGAYRVEYRFKAYENEKIFGMGQYQNDIFDRKGSTLEIVPRNTQAPVPFIYSNRNYGFLWNNPCAGRVTFGTNYTQWDCDSTDELDFWVTAGDCAAEIMAQYGEVTGTVPMMPDYAMGFWQCKLRYVNQEELLNVAREYYRRKIPVKVIIIDFWHWIHHGEWFLDPKCWPDPKAMYDELKSMGIELVVSVWPAMEKKSDNYAETLEKGLLLRANNGLPYASDCGDGNTFIDATNPEARAYMWEKIKKNYCSYGIFNFWLDCAEPEYLFADFDHYTYNAGPAAMTANQYPIDYTRTFYDGLREMGVESPISLTRCAWAGAQRFGTLLWSGDIWSTWESFKRQIPLGQNVGMSGIPWWNTDIGGFMGGDPRKPEYRELLTRWFQWGTFCPVMRLHGIREGVPQEGPEGYTPPNEIWTYGEETCKILEDHIFLREKMRPYITRCMKEAHEVGAPVIRPMFYEFPNDEKAWNLPYQYMFGSDLLVAPVLEAGARSVEAYLPAGEDWIDIRDGKEYAGGQMVTLDAPIESIPVLRRKSAEAMF
ncbi:MAG: glycoside hydrolase family 31 protein [Clostridiales bacterium]|nr:glycoside hydrolase family 31 protein [Clostridiales bacterium]